MTLEELKSEVEKMMNEAHEALKEMHYDKVPQNSYSVGYQCGFSAACLDILCLIKGSHK